ncbi:MAG: glycine cleavage system aminomethyltransferase GcvT [Dysgonamonadaceae bacterium]|nr:glycine cleavage system aminomethyltransferase GcvT [Dysgonamonadaceae bacterium]
MKETPFTFLHRNLGAKMHEFAGYDMPVEYSGIIDEHNTVVNGVGVFDVSHMGEFWFKGKNAAELVQVLTTNNVYSLSKGKAQYTCFTNERGGIIDDLIVYCFGPECYLLVVNAANIEKDKMHFPLYNSNNIDITDASQSMAQLAVQGPFAKATLQKLTDIDLSSIPYYSFTTGKLADVDNVIISNTGYTGCGGFELYFYNDSAVQIWEKIFQAGEEFGIKPVGLGARDTLRLEAGFPLYGNELDYSTTPLEAGLGWITKFTDNNEFIARSILEKQINDGVMRRLVGFEMVGKGIARSGYEIVNGDSVVIGNVTSGSISPATRKAIGMGYISNGDGSPIDLGTVYGRTIFIRIRERLVEAVTVKPPFRR